MGEGVLSVIVLFWYFYKSHEKRFIYWYLLSCLRCLQRNVRKNHPQPPFSRKKKSVRILFHIMIFLLILQYIYQICRNQDPHPGTVWIHNMRFDFNIGWTPTRSRQRALFIYGRQSLYTAKRTEPDPIQIVFFFLFLDQYWFPGSYAICFPFEWLKHTIIELNLKLMCSLF